MFFQLFSQDRNPIYDPNLQIALRKGKIIEKRIKQRKRVINYKFLEFRRLCQHVHFQGQFNGKTEIRQIEQAQGQGRILRLNQAMHQTQQEALLYQNRQKQKQNKENYSNTDLALIRKSQQKNMQNDSGSFYQNPIRIQDNQTIKNNSFQKAQSGSIQVSQNSTPKFFARDKTPIFLVLNSYKEGSDNQLLFQEPEQYAKQSINKTLLLQHPGQNVQIQEISQKSKNVNGQNQNASQRSMLRSQVLLDSWFVLNKFQRFPSTSQVKLLQERQFLQPLQIGLKKQQINISKQGQFNNQTNFIRKEIPPQNRIRSQLTQNFVFQNMIISSIKKSKTFQQKQHPPVNPIKQQDFTIAAKESRSSQQQIQQANTSSFSFNLRQIDVSKLQVNPNFIYRLQNNPMLTKNSKKENMSRKAKEKPK